MTKEEFNKLNINPSSNIPRISTNRPLSMFYKRSNHDSILYTMLQDNKFVSFESTEYQNMHRDRDFELMYVLKGSLTNYLENQVFYFNEGDGCLLNPQIKHTEKLNDDCSVVFINLSESLLNQLLINVPDSGLIFSFLKYNLLDKNDWQRNYLSFNTLNGSESKIFKITLDALQQELVTNKLGANYLQNGLILRLLSELEDKNHFKIQHHALDNSVNNLLVEKVIQLIDINSGNISRTLLENKLHYNAEYLNRIFKEETSKTLTSYAQEIRIHKAKHLLITTNLTIHLISEQLGFSSETYFYHYFKRHVQISPNIYRKRFKVIS